jgi:serine/threonine protein phosphatase PrpC
LAEALENSFEETDVAMSDKYLEENNIIDLSGCTGTVLLVQEDYFVVANCGDSPIFIFRENRSEVFKVEQVSVDHKPDTKEERDRILAVGGVLDQF